MELIAVCDSKTNTAPDFPMGWWSLARSHELQVGEVKAVSALDRDLVLYRTRSGAVRVHDAYCPHLGAHLGVTVVWLASRFNAPSMAGSLVPTARVSTFPTARTFLHGPKSTTGRLARLMVRSICGSIQRAKHPFGKYLPLISLEMMPGRLLGRLNSPSRFTFRI